MAPVRFGWDEQGATFRSGVENLQVPLSAQPAAERRVRGFKGEGRASLSRFGGDVLHGRRFPLLRAQRLAPRAETELEEGLAAESVLPLEARADPSAQAVASRGKILAGRRGFLRLEAQVVLMRLKLPALEQNLLELRDVGREMRHVGQVGFEIGDQGVPTTDAGAKGLTVSSHDADSFRPRTISVGSVPRRKGTRRGSEKTIGPAKFFFAGFQRGAGGLERPAESGAFDGRIPGSDRRIRWIRRSKAKDAAQHPVGSTLHAVDSAVECARLGRRMQHVRHRIHRIGRPNAALSPQNPPERAVECTGFYARMHRIGRSVPAVFRPLSPLRTSIRK